MHQSLTCPECSTKHPLPAAETKKITCEGCGMILVLRKILGEDWASAASPAAEPAKPSISSRRARAGKDAAGGDGGSSKGRPMSKGSSRRSAAKKMRRHVRGGSHVGESADITHEDERHTRVPARKGMHPGIIWGSIGGVIVLGVAAFVMMNSEDDAPPEDKGKEQAAVKQGAEEVPEESGQAEAGNETTTAAKDDGSKEKVVSSKKESTRRKKFDEMTPFDPVEGTTDEQKTAIAGHIKTLGDLEATRAIGIATTAMMEIPRQSLPLLINALLALNFKEEDDTKRGWQVIQAIQICAQRRGEYDNGYRVFEWKTDDEELFSDECATRRFAIMEWWRWWEKVGATWQPEVEEEEDL